MTENEIRDLLREMRDDPVPADSLARVRLGVTERIQSKGRSHVLGPWKVAVALLAIGCIVLLAVLVRPSARISKPVAPLVARQMEIPVEESAPAPVARPRRKSRPRRIVRPVTLPMNITEPGAASVIRIETPDPNVVILLIGD